MKRIATLMVVLTMALSLTACGNQPSNDNASEPLTPETEAPAFEPIPLGDFSAQDFDGNTITKDIFADYDLTMINLWTTSCGYCIEEMPYLNELRSELQEDGKSFNIISVCMDIGNTDEIKDANFAKAKEIIEKTGVTYPNLVPDSVLLEGRLKGIQAFPESFFVNREGNVVSEPYVGAMPKNHWRVTINNEIDKIIQGAEKE